MVRLLSNQVAVRLPEVQGQINGIILPESAKEAPQYGEVIALGPGKKIGSKVIPYEVQIGEKVLFPKYAGTEIKVDEETKYLVLSEHDIICVVEGE